MELTPQLLTDEIDFRIAVRGYDRHEVDDFLERVAVAVGQLQSQLTKAVSRAKAAEARVGELESSGASSATPIEVESGDEAKATPEPDANSDIESQGKPAATAEAGEASEPIAAEAKPVPVAPSAAPSTAIGDDDALNEELRRTLVLAQRTADTAIREAHEEANAILEQANVEARSNREAAEAAHAAARAEARGRLVAEIRELEATREAMRGDTVVLDRYLGEERARVRETIQVLRRLVDDPGSFRTDDPPELSGVATPAELEPVPAAHRDRAADMAESAQATDDVSGAEGSAESADGATGADANVEPESAVTFAPELPKRDVSTGGAGQTTPDEPAAEAATVAPPAEESASVPVTPDVAKVPDGQEPPTAVEASEEPAPPDGTGEPGAESLGQLFGSADSPKDWRNSGSERGDQGPHTQPVAAARFEEESDEAFLAELRRAMSDDEPLGPDEH